MLSVYCLIGECTFPNEQRFALKPHRSERTHICKRERIVRGMEEGRRLLKPKLSEKSTFPPHYLRAISLAQH